MKRRRSCIPGMLFGLIAALILLLGPMAPLLIRLGVKPVCIQGTFPGLHIVRCPGEALPAETFSTEPSPTAAAPTPVAFAAPIPMILDDDGSPDGMLALLYFLQHPAFDVVAVTISPGEAHTEHFAGLVARLLSELGYNHIPVGYGRELPLSGENAFPEPWRAATDDFWGIPLPERDLSSQPRPASTVLLEVLTQASEPVLMFVTGTHTNLAEALALEPGIVDNIRSVAIMGGAINVPGNIASDWPEIDNAVAEWNIWVDPIAAHQVFTSGLPLQLVPLDATNQVVWTPEDATVWRSSEHPAGQYAADVLNWMLRS
ncbi:MAG: nucleoside hydrolase, partial [Anaerolineales bacterium]|nr:nucleoside hydrolase [Anaerolineales bacterium]